MDTLGSIFSALKGGDTQPKSLKSPESGLEVSSAPVDGSTGIEGNSPLLGENMDTEVQQNSIPSDGEKATLMNESSQDTPLESDGLHDETAEVGSKGAAAGPLSENDLQEKLTLGMAPVDTEGLNSKVDAREGQDLVKGDDTSEAHSGIGGVEVGTNGILKSPEVDALKGENEAKVDEKKSESKKFEEKNAAAENLNEDRLDKPVKPDGEKEDKVEVRKKEKLKVKSERKEKSDQETSEDEKIDGGIEVEKGEKKEKSEEEKEEKKERKEESEGKKEKKEKSDREKKRRENLEKKGKLEEKKKKENAEEGTVEQKEGGEDQKERKEKKSKLRSDKLRKKLEKLNGKIERILAKRDEKVLQLKEMLEKERQEKERQEQKEQQEKAPEMEHQVSGKATVSEKSSQEISSKRDFPPPTYERSSSGSLRREDTVLPEELRYHIESEHRGANQMRMDRKLSGSLSRTATLYPSQLTGEDQMGLGDLPGSQLKDGCEDLPVKSQTKDIDLDKTVAVLISKEEVAAEVTSEELQKQSEGSETHCDPHLGTRLQPEMAAI